MRKKNVLLKNEIQETLIKKRKYRKRKNDINNTVFSRTESYDKANVNSVLKNLKSEDVKPKRHRRTKLEMLAAKEKEEKYSKEYITDKVKKSIKGEDIIKFKNYIIRKIDDNNLSVIFKTSDKELFYGYYPTSNLMDCLYFIANKLMMSSKKEFDKPTEDINTLIIALHDFKIFLRSMFKTNDGL